MLVVGANEPPAQTDPPHEPSALQQRTAAWATSSSEHSVVWLVPHASTVSAKGCRGVSGGGGMLGGGGDGGGGVGGGGDGGGGDGGGGGAPGGGIGGIGGEWRMYAMRPASACWLTAPDFR